MPIEATSGADQVDSDTEARARTHESVRERHAPSRGILTVGALGVSLAVLFSLVPRLDDVGVTWDEPWYFNSALRIQTWAGQVVHGPDRPEALSATAIDDVWGWAPYYNPHPPAYKIAMASTEAIAGRWLGSVSGFRLASALWFALLVAAVGWVAARRWGWVAGGAAALAIVLMPRVLGHAHVAATDMPLALFWFCGSFGLAALLRRGGIVPALVAIAGLGLGMATKFTGYLAPIPVLLWATMDRTTRRRIPWASVPVAGGLLLALALNPLAWHGPASYVLDLFRDSLAREAAAPIATFYLGVQHPFSAPWHYPVVMTAITVPLGLLVLATWGALRGARRWRECWLVPLCLIQVLFFWVLIGLPASPSHDGVRLFLPAFPFLAVLAGRGFSAMLAVLKARVGRRRIRLAAVGLSLIFFLPALAQTFEARPYYLSYYGELVGGARGAEARGMEASYWYDAITPAFVAHLNEFLPHGATVATFPTQDYFVYLQGLGRLRNDLQIRDHLPSDFLLLYGRKAVFDSLAWDLYSNSRALRAVSYDGVQLVGLYSMGVRQPTTDDSSESGMEP